jgi:hypothetical protein
MKSRRLMGFPVPRVTPGKWKNITFRLRQGLRSLMSGASRYCRYWRIFANSWRGL